MSSQSPVVHQTVRSQAIHLVIIGLGFCGAAFVAYAVIVGLTGVPWPVAERIAGPASTFLTFVGTALTALSIYVPSGSVPPPQRLSLWITAPIVVTACALAAGAMLWFELSPVLVNGFAIIGIAGALFRLRPV
jgi:hypothetical protein